MKMKSMTKVAAIATGLAIATSMLSLAPMAHAAALTSTQVSSILSLLSSFGANSATIANVNAALTGTTVTSGSTTTTTGNSSCSFSRDLTIGRTGADVTCLQNGLIAGGFSIPAGATGYFGTQTRAAVASWQSSRNVAPAVGYFGPISRAAWNLGGSSSTNTTTNTTTTTTTTTSTVAGCAAGAAFSATTGAACTVTTVAGCAAGAVFSSTTGAACNGSTTVTSGPLTGHGRLTNESSLGNVTSDLSVGDPATSVMGISADAVGGDVAIQRVDAVFTIGGTGSANLDRYVSDVSLYLDGVKLQSIDPALGDKNGREWTIRFSGLNGVIRNGQTGNLYVKVTPVSSISDADAADTITGTLATDSIRAVAADGISDTYGVSVSQAFTVSVAADGTLTVSTASDNPATGQIAVSDTTTTDKVTLLSFNVKAKTQDVTITDLPVQLTTSGIEIGDIVSNIYLYKGSSLIASKSITATTTNVAIATTTFSNINQTIAKDATVNYTIKVDLKKNTEYANGATISAATTVYGWDVSDADGATVTLTTVATGNTQTLSSTGISVVKGTVTQVILSNSGAATIDDVGQYAISFTVTAGDNDIFISGVPGGPLTDATTFIKFATTTTSTTGTTGQPSANFSAASTVTGDVTTAGAQRYAILAGTSRVFTLNVTYTGSTATGWTGLQLSSIAYGLANTLGSTYSANLDSFKTTDLNLVNRP